MPIKIGFKKITDHENIVYYQKGNKESARKTLTLCKEHKQKIVQFWNTNKDFGKVKIFLCDRSRYIHLAPKKSYGVTYINQIVINTDKQVDRFSAILLHELSHVYIKNLISNKISINIPRWLDEGIAVHISDEYLQSSELLYYYLDQRKINGNDPELLSINSLISGDDWHNNSLKNNKVYAYCRSVVEYIESVYKLQHFDNKDFIDTI